MSNEELLKLMEETDLSEAKKIISEDNCLCKVYLFKFKLKKPILMYGYDGIGKFHDLEEFMILVYNDIKVGIIYRHYTFDIHCVVKEEYRNMHLMSNFMRSGILKKEWAKNRKVELCNVHSWDEYNKKKHLASLAGIKIYNAKDIEEYLTMFADYPE